MLFSAFYAVDQVCAQTITLSIEKGTCSDENSKTCGSASFQRKYKVPLPEWLQNHNNKYYFSKIYLGEPGQPFKIDFDTGSADLWVPSKTCKNCGSTHSHFDKTKSKTFKNDGRRISITYADQSQANGTTAFDTFRIGGIKIKNQGFVLVDSDAGVIQTMESDGYLGLAFPNKAKSGFPSFVHNAFDQGLISKNMFAFWLNRNTNSRKGGLLTIGGYNSSHFSGRFKFRILLIFIFIVFEIFHFVLRKFNLG